MVTRHVVDRLAPPGCVTIRTFRFSRVSRGRRSPDAKSWERRTRPTDLLAAILIATAITGAGCRRAAPPDRIRASGHVEATEIQVGSQIGGRLVDVAVSEGDRIDTGALVARIDTRDIELALDRARAERGQADAQLGLLRAGARAEDLRQAEAQVAAAEAEIEAARSELQAAEADLQRFETLLQNNSGSVKQRDDAATRRDVARERLKGAEERGRAAREALARLRAGARREEIAAARARVAMVDAQIAALHKSLDDATVRAPAGGIVTEKLVEPGEIIQPGTPMVVVTKLDEAWAEVFVDEPFVPRIRLGQAATVFTDAGGRGIPGKVTFVSSKAEFTPRNVQTAEERSKLVYRIKISVDNRQGMLKQGMPIEADIPLASAP